MEGRGSRRIARVGHKDIKDGGKGGRKRQGTFRGEGEGQGIKLGSTTVQSPAPSNDGAHLLRSYCSCF